MLTVSTTLTIVVGKGQIVSPPVLCIQETVLTNRKTIILTQTTQAASEKSQETLTEKLHGVI